MLKHAVRVVGTLLVLSMSLGPVGAQALSVETATAARELVAIMRLDRQFKEIMPSVTQLLKGMITRGNPLAERDYDALIPRMLEAMTERFSEFAELQAAIYARHFTADELRELIAFYQQPIGQKLVDKMPAITQQGMALGQVFGRQVGEELGKRMVEELRKKGHNL